MSYKLKYTGADVNSVIGKFKDVSAATPQNGEILIYRNGHWTNGTMAGGYVPAYARTEATSLASDWLSKESATGAALTPDSNTLYCVINGEEYLNKLVRWSETTYVVLSGSGSGGTTDYNALTGKPIINQDLTAVGFTPTNNTYYRHTGATSGSYINGILYLYNGTSYLPLNIEVDQTYTASSTNAQSGTAVASAISTKLDTSKCTYQSVAPTSAATDGGVHMVYLEDEPETKYDGYFYFVAGEGGPVQDVQVNGTSVVTSGVADINIPANLPQSSESIVTGTLPTEEESWTLIRPENLLSTSITLGAFNDGIIDTTSIGDLSTTGVLLFYHFYDLTFYIDEDKYYAADDGYVTYNDTVYKSYRFVKSNSISSYYYLYFDSDGKMYRSTSTSNQITFSNLYLDKDFRASYTITDSNLTNNSDVFVTLSSLYEINLSRNNNQLIFTTFRRPTSAISYSYKISNTSSTGQTNLINTNHELDHYALQPYVNRVVDMWSTITYRPIVLSFVNIGRTTEEIYLCDIPVDKYTSHVSTNDYNLYAGGFSKGFSITNITEDSITLQWTNGYGLGASTLRLTNDGKCYFASTDTGWSTSDVELDITWKHSSCGYLFDSELANEHDDITVFLKVNDPLLIDVACVPSVGYLVFYRELTPDSIYQCSYTFCRASRGSDGTYLLASFIPRGKVIVTNSYIPETTIQKTTEPKSVIIKPIDWVANNRWKQNKMPYTGVSGFGWNSIAYGNGVFVAAPSDGVPYHFLSYSYDGVNWSIASNTSQIAYKFVVFTGEQFMAFEGTNRTSGIRTAYSTDGITWTESTTSSNIERIYKLAYGNGHFVSIYPDRRFSFLEHSTDGITWSTISIPEPYSDSYYEDVQYVNGRFIIVAVDISTSVEPLYILESTDGTTWTTHNTNLSGSIWYTITYGNGKYLISGNAGYIAWSINLEQWNELRPSATTTNSLFASAIYAENKYFVMDCRGNNGTGWYSSDCINWTQMVTSMPIDTSSFSFLGSAITYGNGKIVFLSIGSSYGVYIDNLSSYVCTIENPDIVENNNICIVADGIHDVFPYAISTGAFTLLSLSLPTDNINIDYNIEYLSNPGQILITNTAANKPTRQQIFTGTILTSSWTHQSAPWVNGANPLNWEIITEDYMGHNDTANLGLISSGVYNLLLRSKSSSSSDWEIYTCNNLIPQVEDNYVILEGTVTDKFDFVIYNNAKFEDGEVVPSSGSFMLMEFDEVFEQFEIISLTGDNIEKEGYITQLTNEVFNEEYKATLLNFDSDYNITLYKRNNQVITLITDIIPLANINYTGLTDLSDQAQPVINIINHLKSSPLLLDNLLAGENINITRTNNTAIISSTGGGGGSPSSTQVTGQINIDDWTLVEDKAWFVEKVWNQDTEYSATGVELTGEIKSPDTISLSPYTNSHCYNTNYVGTPTSWSAIGSKSWERRIYSPSGYKIDGGADATPFSIGLSPYQYSSCYNPTSQRSWSSITCSDMSTWSIKYLFSNPKRSLGLEVGKSYTLIAEIPGSEGQEGTELTFTATSMSAEGYVVWYTEDTTETYECIIYDNAEYDYDEEEITHGYGSIIITEDLPSNTIFKSFTSSDTNSYYVATISDKQIILNSNATLYIDTPNSLNNIEKYQYYIKLINNTAVSSTIDYKLSIINTSNEGPCNISNSYVLSDSALDGTIASGDWTLVSNWLNGEDVLDWEYNEDIETILKTKSYTLGVQLDNTYTLKVDLGNDGIKTVSTTAMEESEYLPGVKILDFVFKYYWKQDDSYHSYGTELTEAGQTPMSIGIVPSEDSGHYYNSIDLLSWDTIGAGIDIYDNLDMTTLQAGAGSVAMQFAIFNWERDDAYSATGTELTVAGQTPTSEWITATKNGHCYNSTDQISWSSISVVDECTIISVSGPGLPTSDGYIHELNNELFGPTCKANIDIKSSEIIRVDSIGNGKITLITDNLPVGVTRYSGVVSTSSLSSAMIMLNNIGIIDAPNNNKIYGRKGGAWHKIQAQAVADSQATTIAELNTKINELLQVLRDAGLLESVGLVTYDGTNLIAYGDEASDLIVYDK